MQKEESKESTSAGGRHEQRSQLGACCKNGPGEKAQRFTEGCAAISSGMCEFNKGAGKQRGMYEGGPGLAQCIKEGALKLKEM
eukprot:1161710-Pelagomonas_calceolata.AAC.7